MYCGAKAQWTIGRCKIISKMFEGTVFSSVEEKDRAHLTHTSDTSCMIEGDSDDKSKTRFHLILGSRKTLLSTMPRDVGIVAYTIGQPYRSHPSDSHE